MNATELARIWMLGDERMHEDVRSIAMSSRDSYEAAARIRNYLTECIDEYRPTEGHAHGLVCDILALFPHEVDLGELISMAEQFRANEL